jgi:hypothetical protein
MRLHSYKKSSQSFPHRVQGVQLSRTAQPRSVEAVRMNRQCVFATGLQAKVRVVHPRMDDQMYLGQFVEVRAIDP